MARLFRRTLANTLAITGGGGRATIDIPRDRLITEILLDVNWTTVENNSATIVPRDSTYMGLINRIRLFANGGNPVFRDVGAREAFFLDVVRNRGRVRRMDFVPQITQNTTASGRFSISLPFRLDYQNPTEVLSVSPSRSLFSCALPATAFSSLVLEVTPGAVTDIIPDAADTTTATIGVSLVEAALEEGIDPIPRPEMFRPVRDYQTDLLTGAAFAANAQRLDSDRITTGVIHREHLLLQSAGAAGTPNPLDEVLTTHITNVEWRQNSPVPQTFTDESLASIIDRSVISGLSRRNIYGRDAAAAATGNPVTSSNGVSGVFWFPFDRRYNLSQFVDTSGLKQGDLLYRFTTGAGPSGASASYVRLVESYMV